MVVNIITFTQHLVFIYSIFYVMSIAITIMRYNKISLEKCNITNEELIILCPVCKLSSNDYGHIYSYLNCAVKPELL